MKFLYGKLDKKRYEGSVFTACIVVIIYALVYSNNSAEMR